MFSKDAKISTTLCPYLDTFVHHDNCYGYTNYCGHYHIESTGKLVCILTSYSITGAYAARLLATVSSWNIAGGEHCTMCCDTKTTTSYHHK